jgi:hypothetical protein
MSETKLEEVDLPPKAWAAVAEHVRRSREQVLANIADTSTKATSKRKTTIEIEYEPDSDRRGMNITVSASTKLVAAEKSSSRGFVGKGTDGKTYLFAEDPRQDMLFSPPVVKENMLEFGAKSS